MGMDRQWLEVITDHIEEGAEKLLLVRWVSDPECGYEHMVFLNKEDLEKYLLSHDLDTETTEVLEVQVTKRFGWTKLVELREEV